jgi:hypothetical protein
MFKKVFALGLVASAAAAGAPVSNNLRLRGGFAGGFAKLTEAPGETGLACGHGPRCLLALGSRTPPSVYAGSLCRRRPRSSSERSVFSGVDQLDSVFNPRPPVRDFAD